MAICELPTDIIREINSYLDIYGSSAFRSTCSTISNDLKGVKSAKPIFYKKKDMYYFDFASKDYYKTSSDKVYFEIEDNNSLHRHFPNIYPNTNLLYKIYLYDNNHRYAIRVCYKAYKMAKESYNEYCLYNREYQELKDLILKKQEE